jgi:hypothetical protein
MKPTLLILATTLALGTLAACDRNPEPRTTATPPPAGAGATSAPSGALPNTPANAGAPSEAEKRSDPPVQGREDVRQPEQRKDFQQKGDGAGPKPGG